MKYRYFNINVKNKYAHYVSLSTFLQSRTGFCHHVHYNNTVVTWLCLETSSGTHLCRRAWQMILWVPVIVELSAPLGGTWAAADNDQLSNQTPLALCVAFPCLLMWVFPNKWARTQSRRVPRRNLLDGSCFFPPLLKHSEAASDHWGELVCSCRLFRPFIDS